MTGYWHLYDLSKDHQANLRLEAEKARKILNSGELRRVPPLLKSLIVLLLPLAS